MSNPVVSAVAVAAPALNSYPMFPVVEVVVVVVVVVAPYCISCEPKFMVFPIVAPKSTPKLELSPAPAPKLYWAEEVVTEVVATACWPKACGLSGLVE